ncbi:MAG TPA: IS4 family transposase [Sedimentisphaerales bacterium]|nr:IS4 family transposase [Sedimentisphaerales bacterium]
MATSIDVTSMAGWQVIEAELPEDFEALAKEFKVLEVQYGPAKITTARDLLRLVLLHVGADLKLRQAVALMAESGGPTVSHVTLHKKMRLAGPYLRALVGRVASATETSPERWSGYDVILVDGSSFSGPGADGTDARVHLQLRLADLDIVSAVIEGRTVGESFKRFTWTPGQLVVADRGYCNPPGIAHVVGQGADVLVRVNRSSLPLLDRRAERIDLMSWLRNLRGHQPAERWVCFNDRETNDLYEGRLIACRLPSAEAEKARVRVRRELGSAASPADLEAAQYVVLFTTVPADRMPAVMCMELYRLRWQVELAFKRWKSLCHFDRLPNYRDDTIFSWLYAKLLLALLMHRMVSGTSPLFPPEAQEVPSLALHAVEGDQHRVARNRRRALAA